MNELTIRRIAMGLITDNTRYVADKGQNERTVTLAYVRGVVAMANELIAVCGTEDEEGVRE